MGAADNTGRGGTGAVCDTIALEFIYQATCLSLPI